MKIYTTTLTKGRSLRTSLHPVEVELWLLLGSIGGVLLGFSRSGTLNKTLLKERQEKELGVLSKA